MKVKLSRKFILIIMILVALLAIGRVLKVKGYISKDFFYQLLVKAHLIKPCYNAAINMFEMFKQEGFDYDLENEKVVLDSLNKLLNKDIYESIIPKIPTITHRVYFVSEKKTASLNDFYLREMKVNFSKLNDLGVNWQHNIWTNKQDLFPEQIKNIPGVQIRNIDEFKDQPLYHDLLEILAKGNDLKPHLAEAADLARLLAVQKFGGIYMDMDYELYNPAAFLSLMRKFDFIGGRETPSEFSNYGNAFFAAKANHPIINEALRLELRNRQLANDTPTYIKYPCSNYDTLYFNGPPLLTISYFAKNNINGNDDIILPPWMIFNLNFTRYKNGVSYTNNKPDEDKEPELNAVDKVKKIFKIGQEKKKKNVCNYSSITKANFDLNNENLDKLLTGYIANINTSDLKQYFNLKNAKGDDLKKRDYEDNIYYNLNEKNNFPVIGADMFCGSWTEGGKVFKRKYYWIWQDKKSN